MKTMAGKTIIIKKTGPYDGPIRVIVTVCPSYGQRLMTGMTKCPGCWIPIDTTHWPIEGLLTFFKRFDKKVGVLMSGYRKTHITKPSEPVRMVKNKIKECSEQVN
jgi:hypothetical protein